MDINIAIVFHTYLPENLLPDIEITSDYISLLY